MTQVKLSKPLKKDEAKLREVKPVVCLSKLMESTFHDIHDASVREAYVEAELVNGLAHQIRIIRQQRGWSQKDFAKKLGTTQTTVSRLEDPSYGRYSIRSLLSVSKVFDVALFVRYLPFSKFVPSVWDTSPENFEAAPYAEEISSIEFFDEREDSFYCKALIGNRGANCYTEVDFSSINNSLDVVMALDACTVLTETPVFEFKYLDE
ncbi:hypothetical protein BJN45_05695 [Azonexus hydrophilus]|uniref:HTH cro/C1-type domain-containing protein n=1 Tax=Azonexus hydrophilus TaxID=418702 RepID=A0A1R1I7H4_9RHOO|nr:helix-turn-helix domain-containing protein [Azonexus hydrophilus]OMG54703.1 hypothetical protein BJN45_05695 [Azonexus hydrophilus]